ncbi:hypothetical protein [Nocardioides sp. AE5]|uniref:hypothetical protein n=1 Tax=Nocardioides sp. AE5 TaxID=2962573 RepID=UPI0028816CD8|nr:hypothetical protein [Nocardioides sp. AE5]MDT0202310.1 hypothetical protein [Nocardioides sp. AE5]
MTDRIDDGIGTYDVVLLVEHAVSEQDAAQAVALHNEIADQVVYHVLVPVEDAAARIESAMGALATGEVMTSPALAMSEEDLAEVRRECLEQSQADLDLTLERYRAAGVQAEGQVVHGPPIDALAEVVKAVDAREAIIVTRPHVVAEFFHVDWTSQARRKLGVPVLHLLEHEESDTP